MTITTLLTCPLSPCIDLNEKWAREDVKTKRIIKILLENNDEFNAIRKGSGIEKFTGTLISEGRAFMSKVYKIRVKFDNQKEYSFVMKVSQHKEWKDYATEGSPEIDENGHCLREKQKEMMEIGEQYHNIECKFYKTFPPIPNCPTPKIFYIEEIDSRRNGLILMENLADKASPLSFYESATAEQVFSVARLAANLHFNTDREDLRKHWSKLIGYVFLDLFVDEFQVTGFPMLKTYPQIVELLDKIKPVFSREFCYYALVDKPKEYNAFLCCHGDFQPNNILFRKDKNGEKTSEISAIIDWQLLFGGNPFTDIVRFLVAAVDDELREWIDIKAFNVYYDELQRLYAKVHKTPGFTREQGYELYNLSIVEQTGSYIILLPLVEQRKSALNLEENQSEVFLKRITNAIRRLPPIIQKYNLQRFGESVDWRNLMNQ